MTRAAALGFDVPFAHQEPSPSPHGIHAAFEVMRDLVIRDWTAAQDDSDALPFLGTFPRRLIDRPQEKPNRLAHPRIVIENSVGDPDRKDFSRAFFRRHRRISGFVPGDASKQFLRSRIRAAMPFQPILKVLGHSLLFPASEPDKKESLFARSPPDHFYAE